MRGRLLSLVFTLPACGCNPLMLDAGGPEDAQGFGGSGGTTPTDETSDSANDDADPADGSDGSDGSSSEGGDDDSWNDEASSASCPAWTFPQRNAIVVSPEDASELPLLLQALEPGTAVRF